MKQFYQLTQNERTADLNIYGDITSWPWEELGEVSAYNISQQLAALDVDKINVYINSYGGEVAEGLAIYNALKRHKAKVTTVCDGFACSIASVIFMAGEERVMNESSLLMIHNAWTYAMGNPDELRKQAEDLDAINQASINAYLSRISITEDELKALMDKESWILPADALSWGFATSIGNAEEKGKPAQSAKKAVFAKMTAQTAPPQIDVKELAEQLHLLQQTQSQKQEPKPERSLMQTLAGFFNTQN